MKPLTRYTHPIERGNEIADRALRCLKQLPDGATAVAVADAIDERIADTEAALARMARLGLLATQRKPFAATVYGVKP
jgi:hypothetical protein